MTKKAYELHANAASFVTTGANGKQIVLDQDNPVYETSDLEEQQILDGALNDPSASVKRAEKKGKD